MTRLACASLALLTGLGLSTAQAASLDPTSFQGIITVDGVSSSLTSGTAYLAGDACDVLGLKNSGCDLDTFELVDPNEPFGAFLFPRMTIDWIDDDSFDVTFFSQIGGGNTALVEFTLSELTFKAAGVVKAITGFSFNYAASDVLEFTEGNQAASFSNPVTSFTDSTLTVVFDAFDGDLEADPFSLRFDVRTTDTPAEVPLPAGMGLLGAGLVALAAAARRKRRAA
jgi:hypothetical protein